MRTLISFAVVLAMVGVADAAIVTLVNSAPNQYDVMLQLQTGDGDYLGHEITVTMDVGQVSDPTQATYVGMAAQPAGDLWVNTVATSFGVGSASVTFNTYNPVGSGLPPVPDPQPTSNLYWTVFDTFTGDDVVAAPSPIIIARIPTVGSHGWADVLLGVDGGTTTTRLEIPEPATMGLLAIGGLGVLLRKRR